AGVGIMFGEAPSQKGHRLAARWILREHLLQKPDPFVDLAGTKTNAAQHQPQLRIAAGRFSVQKERRLVEIALHRERAREVLPERGVGGVEAGGFDERRERVVRVPSLFQRSRERLE